MLIFSLTLSVLVYSKRNSSTEYSDLPFALVKTIAFLRLEIEVILVKGFFLKMILSASACQPGYLIILDKYYHNEGFATKCEKHTVK